MSRFDEWMENVVLVLMAVALLAFVVVLVRVALGGDSDLTVRLVK